MGKYSIEDEMYFMQFSRAGMGIRLVRDLICRFGSAKALYEADEDKILRTCSERVKNADEKAEDTGGKSDRDDVRGMYTVRKFLEERKGTDPAAEYEKYGAGKIRYVSFMHPDYPVRLHRIAVKPVGLFYAGKLPGHNDPSAAIVGSRDCSNYGKEMAVSIAKGLAGAGIDVISGMAAGIDGFAHRGALNAADAAGSTFAVLGCGADICYPRSNIDIYTRIKESGGIISEYYPGSQPVGYNFPLRNRIISGLSDTVLVVEAREKSGSLITVDYALEQGKDVCAVPGRAQDRLSSGCNDLIRNGAKLVTCADDIIAELAPKYLQKGKKTAAHSVQGLMTRDERLVYDILEFTPLSAGEIAGRSGLPVSSAISALTGLELSGGCVRIGSGYAKKL